MTTLQSAPVAAPPHAVTPLSDRLHAFANGGPAAWWPLLGSAAHLLTNLVIGVVIIVATLWIAERASRIARRAAGRLHGQSAPDAVLQGFVGSLVRYVIVVIGLIAVLQQLGVQTTSLLTVVGAGSLAIGLALQGSLSNVAAGVMILILRPYRMGDRVEIAGKVGKVHGLDLFITRLHDLDNSVVFIPNAKALGDIIVNYSMPTTRRIVMEFGIDYDDDVDLALALLRDVAKEDERIVSEPAPWAKLTDLNDSTVTVTLRAWTSPDGYIDTRFDLIRSVKLRFEEAGLTFAYPHQVSVETRPWTPPSHARQREARAALEKRATPSTSQSDELPDRTTGSSSEAK
jgi:small conductance mechanosensitive channel